MNEPQGMDDHRTAQIRSIARSTPEQRIAWLEAALRLAAQSGALARERARRAERAAAWTSETGSTRRAAVD